MSMRLKPAGRMNAPAVSKINWTQIIGAVAAILVLFEIDLPPEQQAAIVAGIIAVQNVLTVIWRTWFTEPA